LEKLVNNGTHILFIAPGQLFEIPESLKHKIRHCQYPVDYDKLPRELSRLNLIFRSYFYTLRQIAKYNCSVLIAVDPYGIRTAHRLYHFWPFRNFGYFSFEILFKNELTLVSHKLLKQAEIKASKYLDFCLTQDESRARLLRQENKIYQEIPFFYVPVAPKKRETQRQAVTENLVEFSVIITGTLNSWSGVDDVLAQVGSNWDQRFRLELHSRFRLGSDHVYRKAVSNLTAKGLSVVLHDDPFYNDEEYFRYLSTHDIGLAFYIPQFQQSDDPYIGKNIEYMGLSSGKFSAFMMLGMPTVTFSRGIYMELYQKYQFGSIINCISDLPSALANIADNYHFYRQECLRLYRELLDPEMSIDNICGYLANHLGC